MKFIKNWQFYFDAKDGYDNKYNVISLFAPFWNEFGAKMLIVSEKFIIGGSLIKKVTGDADNNPDIFFTGHIVCVERVEHQLRGDFPHDLFRAVTSRGDEYFFYSDEYTPAMRTMIADMLSSRRLSDYTDFCPKPIFPGRNFI